MNASALEGNGTTEVLATTKAVLREAAPEAVSAAASSGARAFQAFEAGLNATSSAAASESNATADAIKHQDLAASQLVSLNVSQLFNATHVSVNGTLVPIDEQDDERLSPFAAILLLYGVMFLMIGFQAGLFMWKKKHKRSYELVTLLGLWLMPCLISLQLHFWRFIIVWALYTAVTGYLINLCLVKKLESGTPRKVYTFFIAVYKMSKCIGIAGYFMIICEFFGLGPVFRLILPPTTAIDLLWYGLYFGILGRDCAEVAADRMAAGLGASAGGSGGRGLISRVNACGVCGNQMDDFSHLGEESADEKVVQLSCKHCFHDLCIRGWTMVGKKDMCPVCNEKVDLRSLFSERPWETQNVSWIQMLDGVRYMVVWNPIIFLGLSALFHIFGPHHHHHGTVLGPGGVLLHNSSAINATLFPPPMALHGLAG